MPIKNKKAYPKSEMRKRMLTGVESGKWMPKRKAREIKRQLS